MSQLTPEARRFLDLARNDPRNRLPSAVRERIERSLAARVALGLGITASGMAVTKAALANASGVAVKSLVVVGTAAALAGGYWVTTQAPTVAAVSASVSQPTLVSRAPVLEASSPPSENSMDIVEGQARVIESPADAPAPQVSRGEHEPVEGRVGAASHQPSARRSRQEVTQRDPLATTSSLSSELAGLREAQRALRSGQSSQALQLLAQEELRYPSGALAQERAAARVLALCASGQTERARSEASAFEARWPRSSLAAKVRQSCRNRR